jgi:hypothetical protein
MMDQAPKKPNHQFSDKWKRAGAEAQRKVGRKPVARLMWESAVRKDTGHPNGGSQFDSQKAFSAWLQGWTEAEIQSHSKPTPAEGHFVEHKAPPTREQIEDLRNNISALIEFSPTAEDMVLYDKAHDDPQFIFAAHVGDVLDWVLGKMSTEEFLSDGHLDMEHLRHILKR